MPMSVKVTPLTSLFIVVQLIQTVQYLVHCIVALELTYVYTVYLYCITLCVLMNYSSG